MEELLNSIKCGNYRNILESCQQFDDVLTKIKQILNDPLNFIYEPIDYNNIMINKILDF